MFIYATLKRFSFFIESREFEKCLNRLEIVFIKFTEQYV